MCVRFVLGTLLIMHLLQSLSEPLILLVAFGIIFLETGVLTFFFLPGDTLLLSIGFFAHEGTLPLHTVIIVIAVAGFFGNILGYHLGFLLRTKRKEYALLQKVPEKYIIKTEHFYQKYGKLTVVLSRFVPVVRTIAPFLGGVSAMSYKLFVLLSFAGAFIWSSTVITLGYFFGAYIPSYKSGEIALILMITASILTPLIVYLSKRLLKKR